MVLQVSSDDFNNWDCSVWEKNYMGHTVGTPSEYRNHGLISGE